MVTLRLGQVDRVRRVAVVRVVVTEQLVRLVDLDEGDGAGVLVEEPVDVRRGLEQIHQGVGIQTEGTHLAEAVPGAVVQQTDVGFVADALADPRSLELGGFDGVRGR